MLNKWQEEIRKLERADDTKMNREMFNIYNDTLKEVKAKLKDYMTNYEDLPYWKQMQTGQLVKLQDEITELLNSAYPKAVDVATNFKTDQLQKGYNGVFYHAENQEGVSLGFNGLNKDFVRSAVQEPVAGKKLSQRLYKRKEQLAKRAQGAITTAVLQGKGYSYMARIISGNTDATYRQAMRIARTEGGRMRSIGKQKAYEEAEELGVKVQKMWVSTLDSMTRSSHQHLDGQVVDVKDDFIGLEGARAKGPRLFGDPSEDVNCRCTTVTVVNGVKPALRRDNETGEIIKFKTYKEWEKAIDRRRIQLNPEADYLKAHKMISPEKGGREFLSSDGVSISARKVLNSKHDLYVADSLGSARKSFNFYERQIDDVLPKLNLPDGAEKPRFVLADFAKDVGKKHSFGSFDPKTNTVFLDSSKPNQKGVERKLKLANEKWAKSGKTNKFFAVDDDPRSPLVHEMGHKKHYEHISSHAKKHNITYAESKGRFNEKFLDFIESKGYNIGEDISGYAKTHLDENGSYLNKTNEIISEAMTLSVLKDDAKAKQIIKFLEKEGW